MESKQEQDINDEIEDVPVVVKAKPKRASRKMTDEEKLQRKLERDRQKLADQELLLQVKSGIPMSAVQKPIQTYKQAEIIYGEDFTPEINALKQQIASMQNDMQRQQSLLFEKQRKIKERVKNQEQTVIQIKTLQEQRDEKKKLKEEQKKQVQKPSVPGLEQKIDTLAQVQNQQLSFMQQFLQQQQKKEVKQDLFSMLNKTK